jgi:hypothetical protein
MSFRGVSPLGSDIYIAHFANGSAEWRIGGQTGPHWRIAPGPRYYFTASNLAAGRVREQDQ